MGKERADDSLRPSYRSIEELSSYFINSASSVQVLTGRFDYVVRTYIRPALVYADASFEQKPIATVLALVLLILSFVPISVYLMVSFATVFAFVLGGVVSVMIASVGAVFLYSSALVPVLLGIVVVSAFLTVLIVSLFLLLRLGLMVHQDGVGGVVMWGSDIKHYVLGDHAISPPPNEATDGTAPHPRSEGSPNISPKTEAERLDIFSEQEHASQG